jgi:hypothetical protein
MIFSLASSPSGSLSSRYDLTSSTSPQRLSVTSLPLVFFALPAAFLPFLASPSRSTPCLRSCSVGRVFSAACLAPSAADEAASAKMSRARRMKSEMRLRNSGLVTRRLAMVRREEMARWPSRESSLEEGVEGALTSMSRSAVAALYWKSAGSHRAILL